MSQPNDPSAAAVLVALTMVVCALGTAIGTCTVACVKAMDALDARKARKTREARREFDRVNRAK